MIWSIEISPQTENRLRYVHSFVSQMVTSITEVFEAIAEDTARLSAEIYRYFFTTHHLFQIVFVLLVLSTHLVQPFLLLVNTGLQRMTYGKIHIPVRFQSSPAIVAPIQRRVTWSVLSLRWRLWQSGFKCGAFWVGDYRGAAIAGIWPRSVLPYFL